MSKGQSRVSPQRRETAAAPPGFTMLTTSMTLAGLIVAWAGAEGIEAFLTKAQGSTRHYTITFAKWGEREKVQAAGAARIAQLRKLGTGQSIIAAWEVLM